MQGRRIGSADLTWLQGWIDEHPGRSRKQIARDLCRRWDWVDGRGSSRQDRDQQLQVPIKDIYLYALPRGRKR
ncbi:hypothetical protein LBMAG56_12840 [Verrucomicrobiota bacterium]|nr:hypothetical protein LBMAG56_12840 [Verrucomicrobiota bacterium]